MSRMQLWRSSDAPPEYRSLAGDGEWIMLVPSCLREAVQDDLATRLEGYRRIAVSGGMVYIGGQNDNKRIR